MEQPIRLLLIESQPLTRIGIRAVLAEENDIELVGDAGDLENGAVKFKELRPDVTLLGLRFPESCAIDDLDKYFVITPKAKIIVLADHAGDVEITKALRKGAAGYVCKDIAPDELVKAIRKVAAGRKYIPDQIAAVLSEHIGQEELTPTESNVLRMIVGGMSNKEIAFALDVSENTIKSHASNIFDKMGVSDRTSAATMAIRRGMVRLDI